MAVSPQDDTMDIVLRSKNMDHYKPLFQSKGVNSELFFLLEEDDLRYIGIKEDDIECLLKYLNVFRPKTILDDQVTDESNYSPNNMKTQFDHCVHHIRIMNTAISYLTDTIDKYCPRDILIESNKPVSSLMKEIYSVYVEEHSKLTNQILSINPKAHIRKKDFYNRLIDASVVFVVTTTSLFCVALVVQKLVPEYVTK